MKKKIYVSTVGSDLHQSKVTEASSIIFVDQLFATTSIVTLLAGKLTKVILANSVQNCLDHLKRSPDLKAAIEPHLFSENIDLFKGSEKRILHPATPLSLLSALGPDISELIIWSSRGTPGLLSYDGHAEVYIGAAANQKFLSNHILMTSDFPCITIVCAGSKRGEAIEDIWCAGGFVSELRFSGIESIDLDTSAKRALAIFERLGTEELVRLSPVSRMTQRRGQLNEVLFSLRRNTKNIVPVLTDGTVMLAPKVG